MALLTAHVHLKDPSIATGFCLILPDRSGNYRKNGRFPLLWLPADSGEQYNAWARFTCVERLAERHGLAVILPEGQHSQYADMKNGPRWRSYLTHTLPDYLYRNFPVAGAGGLQFGFGYGMGALGLIRAASQKTGMFRALGLADADLKFFTSPSQALSNVDRRWLETIYGVDDPRNIEPPQNVLTLFAGLAKSNTNLKLLCSKQDHAMRLWRRHVPENAWIDISPSSDNWETRETMLRFFISQVILPALQQAGPVA